MNDSMSISLGGTSTLNLAVNNGTHETIALDAGDESRISIGDATALNVTLASGASETVALTSPVGIGTRNYNNLGNKPQINGVTLAGSRTAAELYIVSENTAEGWAAEPAYLPKAGEICLYTDTGRIKIGDGTVAIADLPYIGQEDYDAIMAALLQHTQDASAHVTAAEKAFWNAKLNCDIDGETLIFTRN